MPSKSPIIVIPAPVLELVDMNLPSSKSKANSPSSDIAGLDTKKKDLGSPPKPRSSSFSTLTTPEYVPGAKRPAKTSEPKRVETNAATADENCNGPTSIDDMNRDQDNSCKRRKINATSEAGVSESSESPDISLRKLIPPKDCLIMRKRLKTTSDKLQHDVSNDAAPKTNIEGQDQTTSLQSQGPNLKFDWSAVIARARSHPQEAAEPYFGPVDESSAAVNDDNVKQQSNYKIRTSSSILNPAIMKNNILAYKPLHAMLKYDPPLEAVEAVLRAHPDAALDVTFDGSALKIAAESRVSSLLVLRLLLVAEMAMRKRSLQQEQQQQQVEKPTKVKFVKPSSQETEGKQEKDELETGKPETSHAECNSEGQAPDSQLSMFCGHNPIRWITERRIPVKTAAMLLKWYPIGAFQRPWDDYGAPADENIAEGQYSLQEMEELESPLIDIVDDFARDHYGEPEGGNFNDEEVCKYDSGSDYDDLQEPSSFEYQHQQQASPPETYYLQREHLRRERRWEKFLHILYATDLALRSKRSRPSSPSSVPEGNNRKTQTPAASASADDANTTTTESHAVTALAVAAAPSPKISGPSRPNLKATPSPSAGASSDPETFFRPVHAWIRCLTSPHLGLQRSRPYGAWSILRFMGHRIPSEFTVRDTSDGNRTAFQILAESPASDCRLCLEEVKDVVECLMDADYRSAFLPRSSDGRLIGHVALENGWPCKDLFSRKTSATCA